MLNHTHEIETVSPSNIDYVLPLIRKYMEFYDIRDISDQRNREFFSQFGEHSELGCQFTYIVNGEFIGFATVFLTFATSITAKVGVLNDLYTLEDFRGQGIGRHLIHHCYHYAIARDAKRLQWLTGENNKRAQRLYDSIGANKSVWHFYTYTTE